MPPDQAQGEQGCEMDEGHEFSGSAHIQSFSPEANPVTDRLARLSKWLTQEGRFLSNNRELLDKFCVKVVEAGVPLSRSWRHARTSAQCERGSQFSRCDQPPKAYAAPDCARAEPV
jgi:hypothetical protein